MAIVDAIPDDPENEIKTLVRKTETDEITFEDVYNYGRETANYVLRDPKEASVFALSSAKDKEIDLLKDIPTDSPFTRAIPSIRADDIGKIRKIEGFLIADWEKPRPVLKEARFSCNECGEAVSKEQEDDQLKSPYKCEECGSRKFSVEDKTFFDIQEMTLGGNIQEIEVEFRNGDIINDIEKLREMREQSKSNGKLVYVTGEVQQEIGEDGKRHYKIDGKHIEVVDNPHEEEEE